MTLAEHGVYNLLLDYAWLEEQTATLPADFTVLSKLTGIRKQILSNFVAKYPQLFIKVASNPHLLYNPRLKAEYEEFLETCEKNRLAGVASGKARQSKGTPVQHPLNHSDRDIDKEKRKRKSAAAPPADARFGPFLEFAKASFEAKHHHPPTWDCFGKDGSALAAFLRRAPHVTLDVWQAHVLNFFDSTEAFTVKQGGSLAYFISRFDTFSVGPILEGGSNGKVTSFSERRSQKAATAINTVLERFEKASGDIHRALPPAND